MSTWFITGASRGIGLGLTKALLARGETVIGACRNPDGARDLWELASDFKTKFRYVKLEVTDGASMEAVAKEFQDQTIDVLINNAGILNGRDDRFADISFDEVQKSLVVNSIGPMRVARALLPALQRSKAPKIFQLSSMMGSIGDNKSGGCYAYRMSKAALNMFNKSLAIEFPKILSVVLHPGWVQTEMGTEQAPTTVSDSVDGLIKVMMDRPIADSGKFFDFKGKELPW